MSTPSVILDSTKQNKKTSIAHKSNMGAIILQSNKELHQTKDLFRKFNNIVIEYLTIMTQSAIIMEIEKTKSIVQIGLNAVIHTFKLIFHLTQNINTTYRHCQKACYYYLEYIEQLNRATADVTNISDCTSNCEDDSAHNLNVAINSNNVVTFVYNKTINSIRSESAKIVNRSDTNSNILTQVSYITNVLLNWENTSLTTVMQLNLCQNYLLKYILLFTSECSANGIDESISLTPIACLELVQSKIPMNFDKYEEFVSIFYKQIHKLQKENLYPSDTDLHNNCTELFYNLNVNYSEIFMTKPVKQFIKLLIHSHI